MAGPPERAPFGLARIETKDVRHTSEGQACLNVCAANGWIPQIGEVTRLVSMRRRVAAGEHSESGLNIRKLEYVRWLIAHKRLSYD